MDIAVDYSSAASPTFGDITVEMGDLVVTTTQLEAIAQDMVQRLKTFFGEWFLDNTIGVPYFQQILVKNPKLGEVDALLQDTILATPGATGLNSFQAVLGGTLRQLAVAFSAQTTDGQVDYSGTVEV